jgi:hypothetical protein
MFFSFVISACIIVFIDLLYITQYFIISVFLLCDGCSSIQIVLNSILIIVLLLVIMVSYDHHYKVLGSIVIKNFKED